MKVGQRVEWSPVSPLGGSLQAFVTIVDEVADPARGTTGVRLEIPNGDHCLSAGLKCRMHLDEGS